MHESLDLLQKSVWFSLLVCNTNGLASHQDYFCKESTGYKIFAVFQRYNNPSEHDIKEVVLAPSPSFIYKNPTATFPHGAPMTGKLTEAVA